MPLFSSCNSFVRTDNRTFLFFGIATSFMKRTIAIRIKTISLDKESLVKFRNVRVDAPSRISGIAHNEPC